MRCFVAITLSEEVKEEVYRLIETLKGHGGAIRWVKRDSLHLTLKFLGSVQDERVPEIREAIGRAAKGLSPFFLRATGTGVFPDYRRPRVIWVGVERERALEDLYGRIEEEFEHLGFERERRGLTPHITIGRVKEPETVRGVLKELRGYKDREFGKIYVDRVVLMKSILRPEGADYERVSEALFQTS